MSKLNVLCPSMKDWIFAHCYSRHIVAIDYCRTFFFRHSIWPSCPILIFDECSFGANYFQYYTRDNGNRRRLAQFWLNSLQKHKWGTSTYGNIDKFSLRMAVLGQSYESCAAVDGWVKFVIENKVKELDLRIKRVSDNIFSTYWLDNCFFDCASLTELYLDYCGIWLEYDFIVNLPSLKRLKLSEVEINRDWLSRLIEGCPLLEDLCVESCRGLEAIYVSAESAPNLKSLKLNFTYVYLIDIGSPRLESVELSGNLPECYQIFNIDLGTVKEMKLKKLHMTDERLNIYLLEESPLLETLIIDDYTGLERIRVPQKIKRFSMFGCRGIVEAEELSPNLESLEYSGDGNIISFYCLDNLRSADVKISLDPKELNDTWFFRLKKLLEVFVKCKVLTLVCPSDQIIIFPGALCERLLPSLHDLKHLKLEIRTLSTSSSKVVDGLIWLFPGLESLTIKSGSMEKLIKFQSQTRRTCTATMMKK